MIAPSPWKIQLINLHHPGLPLLLLHPRPLPPPMQPNPSLTPHLHPRHLHHLRECAPLAVSHPATTPHPRFLTRQILWLLHRALLQQLPGPQPSALLLHTSLKDWRGAVTEERDSHLRTTHNPSSQVCVCRNSRRLVNESTVWTEKSVPAGWTIR